MSSYSDNSGDAGTEGSESVEGGKLQDAGRRKFSRQALTGSAVLLSLGNRAAWGQDDNCMSVTTLASFNPATGMFISAPAGRPDHNETLAAEIHHVSFPYDGDYLGTGVGTDGVTIYSTCQDPTSLDRVCLIEAKDCPPSL